MPGPAQTPFSLLSSSPISGATVDTLSIPTHGCSPRCSEPALHIALSSPECGAIASNSKLGKDEEASLNAAVKRLPLVRICHLSKACNLRPKEQSTENNNRKPAWLQFQTKVARIRPPHRYICKRGAGRAAVCTDARWSPFGCARPARTAARGTSPTPAPASRGREGPPQRGDSGADTCSPRELTPRC